MSLVYQTEFNSYKFRCLVDIYNIAWFVADDITTSLGGYGLLDYIPAQYKRPAFEFDRQGYNLNSLQLQDEQYLIHEIGVGALLCQVSENEDVRNWIVTILIPNIRTFTMHLKTKVLENVIVERHERLVKKDEQLQQVYSQLETALMELEECKEQVTTRDEQLFALNAQLESSTEVLKKADKHLTTLNLQVMQLQSKCSHYERNTTEHYSVGVYKLNHNDQYYVLRARDVYFRKRKKQLMKTYARAEELVYFPSASNNLVSQIQDAVKLRGGHYVRSRFFVNLSDEELKQMITGLK